MFFRVLYFWWSSVHSSCIDVVFNKYRLNYNIYVVQNVILLWSSFISSCVAAVYNKCIVLYVMLQHKVKFTMMNPMMTSSVKYILQESYIFHNLGMNPELKSWIKYNNLPNSRDTRHKLNGKVY